MSARPRKATRSCDFPEPAEARGKDRTRATFPEAAKPPKKKTGQLLDAPMAVTSGGSIVINVTHLDLDPNEPDLVRRLVAEGHAVFVAVAVRTDLRAEVLGETQDALADVVGRVGRRVMRRDGGG